jgi:hypothetical protein
MMIYTYANVKQHKGHYLIIRTFSGATAHSYTGGQPATPNSVCSAADFMVQLFT